MRPVLVGSVAAMERGCLPAWRSGVTGDVDFCGDKDFIFSSASEFEGVKLQHRSNETSAVAIDPRGTLRIDCQAEDDVSAAIRATDDLATASMFGFDCLCISEETQLALKLAYIRNDGPHNEKNARDIEFWLGRDIRVKPCHVAVFVAMWHKADVIFKLEKSDPMVSWGYSELMGRMKWR